MVLPNKFTETLAKEVSKEVDFFIFDLFFPFSPVRASSVQTQLVFYGSGSSGDIMVCLSSHNGDIMVTSW